MKLRNALTFVAAAFALLAVSGPARAEPAHVLKSLTPDRAQTLIEQVKSCKGLGDPCKSNANCCSGNCVKGHAEGKPGAWCDSPK